MFNYKWGIIIIVAMLTIFTINSAFADDINREFNVSIENRNIDSVSIEDMNIESNVRLKIMKYRIMKIHSQI